MDKQSIVRYLTAFGFAALLFLFTFGVMVLTYKNPPLMLAWVILFHAFARYHTTRLEQGD